MDVKKDVKNNTVVPNDGSYLGAKKGKQLKDKKVKEDFDKAWKSQKELLKDSTVKLFKERTSISVRWQSFVGWDDSKLIEPNRIKKGLGALGRGKFPHTANAVNNAVAIALEIDRKIKADSFSWQDYPQWLPSDIRPKDDIKPEDKTVAQWIDEYEEHYWLSRDKEEYKDHSNWKKGYLRYFKYISDWSQTPSKELFDNACRTYPNEITQLRQFSQRTRLYFYCLQPQTSLQCQKPSCGNTSKYHR